MSLRVALALGLGLLAVPLTVLAMTAAERAAILAPTTDFTAPERFEELQGGSATNRKRLDREAFSQPSSSLEFTERGDFFVGNGFFKRLWVTAPSSTSSADGLGPLYNARACQRCHLKDGRGHPPAGPDDSAVSMFLRLSVPPRTAEEEAALAAHLIDVVAEPVYGTQLQDLAIAGIAAEGRMLIDYTEEAVELAGGEIAHLRKPSYAIGDPGYGPPDPAVMLSPRVAQPMIGLGLLEAIDEADILAAADPDDADGDGISGRVNLAWSAEEGRVAPGRFGWKAGKVTIADQSAAAFAGDIGISSPLEPHPWGDCTEHQEACRAAPTGEGPGGTPEADTDVQDRVVFYSRNLAVPARRDVGAPEVLEGKRLFYESGCIACHTPKHATRRDWPVKALAGQLVWPYSDLLLHDMGEGLADDRPEGLASGREWRTQPLWGIGLTETVNDHTFFLHDGRARNLTEAILWHGGEAEPAREAFRLMPPEDRAALLAFLESL
ncbi:MAG: di-heme oxidoredictase family protein [Geminicoccaceae bacterium]